MRVLAIDVSVNGCSVAYQGGVNADILQNRAETERGQAEKLVPMIDRLMQDADVPISALEAVIVTRGPGSFTGVRIGLATARSLALSLQIPVIGVSTLDAIAHGHTTPDALFLIDTKRGDYYGQIGYGRAPRIWSMDEVTNFQGDSVKDMIPSMESVIALGRILSTGVQGYDLNAVPEPIYLRDAEVSVSKQKTLQVIPL